MLVIILCPDYSEVDSVLPRGDGGIAVNKTLMSLLYFAARAFSFLNIKPMNLIEHVPLSYKSS